MIRKRYADCRYGQIHWHMQMAEEPLAPPLVCLHPAPYSGAYFYTVMPLLGTTRHVMAPDYPGYGGSTRPPRMPSIADYAGALIDSLESMAERNGGPIDLLGFHTGCLVGLELALLRPDLVRGLVLIDVPYFERETRNSLLPKVASPKTLTPELESLAPRWTFNIGGDRLDSMSYTRALELFIQEMLSGAESHWAFHAAFTYPCEERFSALNRHCEVIATQSGLLEPTRTCVTILSDATLTEAPQVTRAVFEEGAQSITEVIHRSLKHC